MLKTNLISLNKSFLVGQILPQYKTVSRVLIVQYLLLVNSFNFCLHHNGRHAKYKYFSSNHPKYVISSASHGCQWRTTEQPEMQPHISRPWIEMRLHKDVGPIIVQFAPRRQIPAHGISCAAFVSEPSSSGYSVIPWLRKIPCTPWRRKNGIYKWHSQQFSVENSTCGSRYNF